MDVIYKIQFGNDKLKLHLQIILTAKVQMQQMIRSPAQNSDQQLNEQINDKLSQLWTGMKDKKKQFIRNLTPSYSRRSQYSHSEANVSSQNLQQTQNQLLKIKQKLAYQNSAKKQVDSQNKKLKSIISQLTNDKKILLSQIQNFSHSQLNGVAQGTCAETLNQSSINQCNQYNNSHSYLQRPSGKTAQFSTNKKKRVSDNSQTYISMKPIRQQQKENHRQNNQKSNNSVMNVCQKTQILQDLSKNRLIQLLKSTSEYRQFAYYYDSHELSYLKRLQNQHRKNCAHDNSKAQKRLWAPKELIETLKNMNRQQQMGLSSSQVQMIISQMKYYFQVNQETKIKKISDQFKTKLKKVQRQKQNNVPYDLVRLSNAMIRQQPQSNTAARRKRVNTLKR